MPSPFEFPREAEPCPAYMLREGDLLIHQDFHGNIGMIVKIETCVLDKRGDYTHLDVSALTDGVIKTVRFDMGQEVEIIGDEDENLDDRR